MKVDIAIKETVYEFDADLGERLLYAGLRSGVPLAYECASGTCGSCRATLSEGKVHNLWPEAPGIPAARRNSASVLLCQVSATSHCCFLTESAMRHCHSEFIPAYFDGVISNLHMLTQDVLLAEVMLPVPLHFAPGQFAMVNVSSVAGWRAYSIVEGDASDRVSFIVKRKPGGNMTRWFFEHCLAGAPLRLFGPLGAATFRPETDGDIVLLAGGSGVSMVLSILDSATRQGHTERHRADVVFGVRTAYDTFCLDRLAAFVAAAPDNVSITVALSDSSDLHALRSTHPLLRFESGFVHSVAEDVIQISENSTIGFIAGPPPMIEASLRYFLLKARLPASNIRYDKFS